LLTTRGFGRFSSAFRIAACHFPGTFFRAVGVERGRDLEQNDDPEN
jgi:hypothetical protein